MKKSRQNSTGQSALWIYNPGLDLIVGCGAWSAPLLLLSYFSAASSARAWSVAFYVLALFFNYPHYMATIYRAYHRSEDFQKYRIFTVHITALMLLTLLLSHFWLRLLPWIFTIYLTWSPWHYSGQNYGLFMMFARRAGADPQKPERRAPYGAFIVSYLILFLGFHTGPSTDSLFISLNIPALVSRWEQIILFALFIVLTLFGFSRYRMAQADSGGHAVFFAVPLVPAAGRDFADQGHRDSAEPLQFGRAGGDALGAISLDHQLLRASRGHGGEGQQLASAGLFRGPGDRRHRAFRAWSVAGQPYFPSRFYFQFFDFH